MFARAHARSNSGHIILCYCNPFNNNTNEYKMKVFVYTIFPYDTYLLLLLLLAVHNNREIACDNFNSWFIFSVHDLTKSRCIFSTSLFSLYFPFFCVFGFCFDFYNYNILIPIEYLLSHSYEPLFSRSFSDPFLPLSLAHCLLLCTAPQLFHKFRFQSHNVN